MKTIFLIILISLCSIFVSAHDFAQQLKESQETDLCMKEQIALGVERSQINCK